MIAAMITEGDANPAESVCATRVTDADPDPAASGAGHRLVR